MTLDSLDPSIYVQQDICLIRVSRSAYEEALVFLYLNGTIS